MANRCFTYCVGEWGCRVRVYERRPGGILYVSAWDPTLRNGKGGYRRQSLGHRDRKRAKAYAREVGGRFRRDEAGFKPGPLGLSDLFELFRQERLPEMHGKHRRETKRQLPLWLEVLGGSFDVRSFSRREWDYFCRFRSDGVIDAYGREVKDPDKRRRISPRVCAKDLAFLRSVFKWATEWRHPRTRQFLLEVNPTRGLALPKEKNPKRPVATYDRFLKLLKVATSVRVKAGRGKQVRWVRTPLRELLILAEGSGRRIGAIVQLRWADWLPDSGTSGALRWRADSDKLGREWVVPVTPEVRQAIEAWRRESPGVGEAAMFPQANQPGCCITVDLAAKWLKEAERLAGLDHMERGLWHPFRRKWAMERKGLELRDVAHAGGWKDPTTLLKAYQQPDPETLERVVTQRRKLREA